MAVRLVFTLDSPFNTTLVDEASGLVIYEIETKMSLVTGETVIRKPLPSAYFFSRSFEPRKFTWNPYFQSLVMIRSRGTASGAFRLYRSCEAPVEDVVF